MSMAPFVSANPSAKSSQWLWSPKISQIQILIATCLPPHPPPPQSLGRAAVNLGFGVLDNLLELMHVC